MNMIRKNGGFTLVELIVVIAILAILAGVAVPAYSGYIEKAQDAAVITELDAIQTAAQAANATAGEITQITINNVSSSKHSVTITTTAPTNISKKFASDFKVFFTGAEGTDVTTDVQTITVTIPEISNWANSSFGKATTPGAVWTAKHGWEVGTTPSA